MTDIDVLIVGGGPAGMVAGASIEVDFYQQKDRATANAAEPLRHRALNNEFRTFIVSPRTLGELRKYYHKEANTELVGEVDKDLTGHPIDRIEAAVQAA